VAAKSGDTAIVTKGLNRGIEINVTDEYGQTALMLAADQGHVDTAKIILQHGARLNLQNKRGGTALMFASFNGHLEIVTELLKAGADVNIKSKNGATALMQAAIMQNQTAVQIINILLDQKAEINAQDEEGYTALMRAVDFPPPPPRPPFGGAKEQKEYDNFKGQEEIRLMVVKTLVKRGADLDLRDQRGRTALELAQMNHQTRISEILKSR
jgi:ankyrin repeat protein